MFLLKILQLNVVLIEVSIQKILEVFSKVNVSKFTKWRVKPNYLSISVIASSIWIITVGTHYLDGPAVSTTVIFASGCVLSSSVGVHWVYVLQSISESTSFEDFIIYLFLFFSTKTSFTSALLYMTIDLYANSKSVTF